MMDVELGVSKSVLFSRHSCEFFFGSADIEIFRLSFDV